MTRWLLAALIVAGLLVPQPAGASFVRIHYRVVEESRIDIYTDYFLRFEAGKGERNRVAIRQTGARTWVVRDRGARLHVGRDCRARSRHRAVCRADHFLDRLRVNLGDRGDRAVVRGLPAGPPVAVRGEQGNDRLSGGAALDRLRGGAGRDVLTGLRGDDALGGGRGRDVMRGGPGDDSIGAADGATATGRDRVHGGSGTDSVTYGPRKRPVRVRLGAGARGGSGSERDVLTGIENATGGGGDDVLTGDDGPNSLRGGGGDDALLGQGGDDRLEGGNGADRIQAGDGADVIGHLDGYGFGSAADDLVCGPGPDIVGEVDATLRLGADCETVRYFLLDGPAQPRRAADSLTFTLPCFSGTCGSAARLTVTTPPEQAPWSFDGPRGVELGSVEVPRFGANDTVEVTVALNGTGRALLASGNPTLTVRWGEYVAWSFVLA